MAPSRSAGILKSDLLRAVREVDKLHEIFTNALTLDFDKFGHSTASSFQDRMKTLHSEMRREFKQRTIPIVPSPATPATPQPPSVEADDSNADGLGLTGALGQVAEERRGGGKPAGRTVNRRGSVGIRGGQRVRRKWRRDTFHLRVREKSSRQPVTGEQGVTHYLILTTHHLILA